MRIKSFTSQVHLPKINHKIDYNNVRAESVKIYMKIPIGRIECHAQSAFTSFILTRVVAYNTPRYRYTHTHDRLEFYRRARWKVYAVAYFASALYDPASLYDRPVGARITLSPDEDSRRVKIKDSRGRSLSASLKMKELPLGYYALCVIVLFCFFFVDLLKLFGEGCLVRLFLSLEFFRESSQGFSDWG